jgi:hypothetical protein
VEPSSTGKVKWMEGNGDSSGAPVSRLDARLESLVAPEGAPAGRPALSPEAPPAPPQREELKEVIEELRSMRAAFLSLPPLDTVDERLAAAEAGIVRIEAAVTRVLRGLDYVYQLGVLEAALQLPVEEGPRVERHPAEADLDR